MAHPLEVAALVPVLSSFPTAAAITDRQGVIRWANAQCASLTGKEIVGWSIGSLFEDASSPELLAALHRAVTEGASWMGEVARRRGHGESSEFELTVTPISDTSGTVTHALWTLRDISALKAVTVQLDQLQKVVSSAQLAAHFGVFRWDAKTGKSQWSAETSVLYGLDPATTEPSVEAWLQSVHPADRERVLQEFHNSLEASNLDGRLSLQYLSADGRRWIAGYGQLYRDSDGKPEQLVGINLDVTTSKLNELALSHQAEFTQGVFDSTDAHLAVVDADGRILDVNSAWRQFAVENLGALEGAWGPGANYFRGCVPGAGDMQSAEQAYEGLRQVQTGRLPRFEMECPCHSPGEQRWFVMRVLPFLGRPGTVLVSHTNVTERRRVENALRESEERHRRVSSLMSDVAYGCRTSESGVYSIEWLTGASERITGYSADELMAMQCWGSLVVEEDRPLFERQVRGLTPGSSGYCELRVRHKDGSIRWLASSAECNQWPDHPRATQTFGGLVDITERKLAEAALVESDRVLRESQVIAGLGSYVLNLATGAWSSSAVLDGLLGIEPTSEHNIENWTSLVHPEDRGMVVDYFQYDVLGQGRRFDREYRIIRRNDQAERWVHGLGRLEFDPDGRPLTMYGTIQDITERRKADVALRESELRYRAVFESSRDALFIADSGSGMIVDANPAAQALVGRSLEEIRTMHQTELHPPEDVLVATASFDRDRRHSLTSLHRVIRPDGQRIPVEVVANRMRDSSGRELILGAFRDLTERNRAEQERATLSAQLMQAQKMESVGRLAGGVAHDFNNVLTVINGHSELLLARLGPEDPNRSSVEAILKAGERAEGLTHQLLAFSRKQVLQPQVLDLNRAVSETESMLTRLVGEDIELRVELNARAAMVSADPHQLQQVILNLVVNARDAMPNGGKVLIATADVVMEQREEHSAGRYVTLKVTDNGVGMDDETKRRIFEPFFTTKAVGKGTGLGLSMVHGIVAQSGGYIDVQSEPGRGTSFQIYLPHVDEPRTSIRETVRGPRLRGNETVLVVEDQPDVLDYVVDVLTTFGYQVIMAPGMAPALALFQQQQSRIDLVLTDVVMPNGSGRELANELDKLQPGVKVLFMSGYTDDVIVQHLFHHEDMHFIHKPFGPEQLAAKVRTVLGQ